MKTKREIKRFCQGQFYSDDKNTVPWQPFEDYSKEQVKEFVDELAYALDRFINKEV